MQIDSKRVIASGLAGGVGGAVLHGAAAMVNAPEGKKLSAGMRAACRGAGLGLLYGAIGGALAPQFQRFIG